MLRKIRIEIDASQWPDGCTKHILWALVKAWETVLELLSVGLRGSRKLEDPDGKPCGFVEIE